MTIIMINTRYYMFVYLLMLLYFSNPKAQRADQYNFSGVRLQNSIGKGGRGGGYSMEALLPS